MNTKKENIENFKTAINSTIRSISNSQKVEVSWGSQSINPNKKSIKLPELDNLNSISDLNKIRACLLYTSPSPRDNR